MEGQIVTLSRVNRRPPRADAIPHRHLIVGGPSLNKGRSLNGS
ncbi:MAG: hypothetical protein HW404_151 [Anaerolineales bacterium]|nr:hypothetical protein [Anaerolineales bacterium]